MTECTNIDLQERLPELLSGTLPASERVAVELHLASCAACDAEYALLEAVLRARPEPPELDIAAIVAALPSPPGTGASETPLLDAEARRPLRIVTGGHAASSARPVRRSTAGRGAQLFAGSNLMRMAAALTVVAVGGLSMVVANRSPDSLTGIDGRSMGVVEDSSFVVAALPTAANPYAPEASVVEPVVSVAPAMLPLQELADYSHEELTLLLERLDEWDGAPRADSTDVSELDFGADAGSEL